MSRVAALSLIVAGAACSSAPSDVVAFSNDPLSSKQGYMPLIGVPASWSRASSEVVVAVLDNGIDIHHVDLSTRLWTNVGEVAGNGLDDDGDGRIDDVHGWNFLDENGDVGLDGAELDAVDASHGTSVAGIIGAQTNNGQGVAACCPSCTLMILKARDFVRTGSVLPHFGEAVDYAIAHGARVLNVSDGALVGSFGGDLETELEAAAQRAEQAGLLIVASAGNDGADSVRLPARIPSVLAVAAVDWYAVPAAWTSFGSEIGIAAPGVFIETTTRGSNYDYFEGTSAAAPIVAALAAMVFSEHPDWSPAQVVSRIEATARPAQLGSRTDVIGRFGAGVVSFGDALAE